MGARFHCILGAHPAPVRAKVRRLLWPQASCAAATGNSNAGFRTPQILGHVRAPMAWIETTTPFRR